MSRTIGTLDRAQIDIHNAGDETLGDGEPIRGPAPSIPRGGFSGLQSMVRLGLDILTEGYSVDLS